MINSVLNTGLQGMQQSQQNIQTAAQEINSAGAALSETAKQSSSDVGQNNSDSARQVSTQDLIDPIVDLKIEQHVFDASAKIVKTADEMLGTLMDIKA